MKKNLTFFKILQEFYAKEFRCSTKNVSQSKKLKGGLCSAKDRDANHLGLRSGVDSIKQNYRGSLSSGWFEL